MDLFNPVCRMKIYVDVLPKEPLECLFCYQTQDYKDAKPQCHLKRGAVCELLYVRKCPYLERGVSNIDLLFT